MTESPKRSMTESRKAPNVLARLCLRARMPVEHVRQAHPKVNPTGQKEPALNQQVGNARIQEDAGYGQDIRVSRKKARAFAIFARIQSVAGLIAPVAIRAKLYHVRSFVGGPPHVWFSQ